MIRLERFAYSPIGTFGRLYVADRVFYTVEPPWKDNAVNESCIPEGSYGIRKDTSGEFRGYEITNVSGRTQIEMHVGNTEDDTWGCICPGLNLGYVKGKWAVANSKAAFRELRQVMAEKKPTQIKIEGASSSANSSAGGTS